MFIFIVFDSSWNIYVMIVLEMLKLKISNFKFFEKKKTETIWNRTHLYLYLHKEWEQVALQKINFIFYNLNNFLNVKTNEWTRSKIRFFCSVHQKTLTCLCF